MIELRPYRLFIESSQKRYQPVGVQALSLEYSAVTLAIGLARASGVFVCDLYIVACYAVHASSGYNVCDNGYKLPLMYLMMLIPLMPMGPGKLAIDHWIRTRVSRF